ncbi:RNA polymerase, sigma subunit, ECF family [Variovorax sp. YR216]|nr:RNA polymerase, sigma subunit, ECF family [Variovorax sp. YR216]
MPDDQLMLAYAGGDASAFDLLYARHESGLFRFVRRLLGVRLAAEVGEVFQQTWARIVSSRDTFSPEDTSWRVWAFTIAYELAIEQLRLSGRQAVFYAHDEDGDGLEAARIFGIGVLRGAADAHPSAQELAFWRAAGRRLQACLDELPDDQRAAFLLHHEEGFTVEVLARAIGVDVDTVCDRLRRGLERLQDCMERYLTVLERHA